MTYDEVRLLVATNPRQARQVLASTIDAGGREFDLIIERAADPGEGRVRQVLANLAKTPATREKLAPYLLKWIDRETDEFARVAIIAALRNVDSTRWKETSEVLPQLVDTYRYVAERLCHRVRNALPAPLSQLRRISEISEQAPPELRADLVSATSRLKDEMRLLSRIVEFEEGDDYFRWQSVRLASWIRNFARNYGERFGTLSVQFRLADPILESSEIRANYYLLDTLFWNLFRNSQQAVGESAIVTIGISSASSQLVITCTDNGTGLPDALQDVAFQDQFSTKGSGRGRGLLEVADAVRQLMGTARLVRDSSGSLRIQISFPRTST